MVLVLGLLGYQSEAHSSHVMIPKTFRKRIREPTLPQPTMDAPRVYSLSHVVVDVFLWSVCFLCFSILRVVMLHVRSSEYGRLHRR